MHSYTFIASISALAGYTMAEAQPGFDFPGYAIAPAPTSPSGPRLAARQDMDCFASITEDVFVAETPSADDLNEWLMSQTYDIDECTITAPSSLSSDIVSYASYVSEFWEGAESRWNEVDTMCDADTMRVDMTPVGCTETQTALFTSGSETETVELPYATVPSKSFTKEGGSMGQKGMMSLGAVVGVAFAVVFAL
jgi:hypothetical protein